MTDQLTQLNRANIPGRGRKQPVAPPAAQEPFRLHPLEPPTSGSRSDFLPLNEIDFIGRTPFAAQPRELAPLAPGDLGALRPPPVLMPLSDLDFMPGATPPETQQEEIQRQAQRWVSQTFVATLLKQARNSPFKSDLFSGGRGGEAFSPLLDQQLADRVAPAIAGRLADRIARRIVARRAYAQQNPAPADAIDPAPVERDLKRGIDPHQNVRFHATPAL